MTMTIALMKQIAAEHGGIEKVRRIRYGDGQTLVFDNRDLKEYLREKDLPTSDLTNKVTDDKLVEIGGVEFLKLPKDDGAGNLIWIYKEISPIVELLFANNPKMFKHTYIDASKP